MMAGQGRQGHRGPRRCHRHRPRRIRCMDGELQRVQQQGRLRGLIRTRSARRRRSICRDRTGAVGVGLRFRSEGRTGRFRRWIRRWDLGRIRGLRGVRGRMGQSSRVILGVDCADSTVGVQHHVSLPITIRYVRERKRSCVVFAVRARRRVHSLGWVHWDARVFFVDSLIRCVWLLGTVSFRFVSFRTLYTLPFYAGGSRVGVGRRMQDADRRACSGCSCVGRAKVSSSAGRR